MRPAGSAWTIRLLLGAIGLGLLLGIGLWAVYHP
jgi:hypothetical protein